MLILPKGPNPSLPLQGMLHLHAAALFEVPTPLGVIGVGVTLDLDMPSDGHMGRFGEMDGVHVTIFAHVLAEKHPFPCPGMEKVFLRHPLFGLGRMSSGCPLPQRFEDGAIHLTEDAFAHHVALVVGPSLNNGIELPYQCIGRGLLVRLDDASDFVQECMNTLGGGFD
jgi:hypothetical protein